MKNKFTYNKTFVATFSIQL